VGIELRFLGVGGAFDPAFGSSSAIVESGADTSLLIDCGCTTYRNLQQSGRVESITHVLITHMHDDHVGSLGTLVFHHYYITGKKLVILARPPLMAQIERLLSLQITHAALEDFFVIRELDPGATAAANQVGEIRIESLDTFGLHQAGMQSYAYLLWKQNELAAYSGDLGDPNVLFNAIKVRKPKTVCVYHDMCFIRLGNKAHAYYKDIEKHSPEFEIYGYHHNPHRAPDDLQVKIVADFPEKLMPGIVLPEAKHGL
jgi:ribonuclease BN (tRNA processing enzyme)